MEQYYIPSQNVGRFRKSNIHPILKNGNILLPLKLWNVNMFLYVQCNYTCRLENYTRNYSTVNSINKKKAKWLT